MIDPEQMKDVYALIGFFAGLYVFYRGFRDIQLERLIANTALSKIRSLAVGTVKISGKAKCLSTAIKDPIFSQDCCYYDITVSRWVKVGESNQWETVHRDVSLAPFFLEDETGSILIRPANAQLIMKKAVHWQLNGTFWTNEIPGAEHTYARSVCPIGQVKIDAYIVRADEPLCVYGVAALPEEPAQNPISPNYEDSIRAFNSALSNQSALIMRKGDGTDFVISNESQGKLIWDIELRSALNILIGMALAIACAAHLASSWHLI